ncbi:MAG: protein kinase domain-containing protein [Anaerolineae bacterium]
MEVIESLIGRTLGQYRLVEQLGKGGMATVYKAYQAALDRYVAVKVLHPFVAAEEEFIRRFHQEARAVAALRHSNIVQVYDFGEENSIYYEGRTLKERADG